MHSVIGDITCGDIEVVAAFDIDKRKVGLKIGEAIFSLPNCVKRFSENEFAGADTLVSMSPILDGCAAHMSEYSAEKAFRPADIESANIVDILRKSKAKVLVSYLPVGSQLATEFYADCCLEAGVAMVNCAPCFIASNPVWAKKFKDKNIPIIGDDIKSQVGATIVHRLLTRLFEDRGVSLKRTYQLNTGGNTDFLNMLSRERLASKKISKTRAVTSQLSQEISEDNVHIGPSDYVPWQGDNKICFIRMEGEGFCQEPIEIELRLSVQDSPNSAGVVVDAIRCAGLALKIGRGGVIEEASSWFMKSPPTQLSDSIAHKQLEKFISQD
ncbi:MAG: inositol-3-phosphate synthase [Colwellia sp.]